MELTGKGGAGAGGDERELLTSESRLDDLPVGGLKARRREGKDKQESGTPQRRKKSSRALRPTHVAKEVRVPAGVGVAGGLSCGGLVLGDLGRGGSVSVDGSVLSGDVATSGGYCDGIGGGGGRGAHSEVRGGRSGSWEGGGGREESTSSGDFLVSSSGSKVPRLSPL